VGGVRKGLGCLLLVAGVCAAATVVLLLAAAWFVQGTLSSLDTAPKPLPVPEITEQSELRIGVINDSLKKIFENGEAGAISINSELVNGWLRLTPDQNLRFIGDHSWITIAGERLSAQVSLPLDPVNIEGRFFNGVVVASGSIVGKRVRFFIHDIQMEGPAAEKLGWAVRQFIEGRDLTSMLGLNELMQEDLLNRCTLAIKASTIRLECAAR
jgi:hypothetical protein